MVMHTELYHIKWKHADDYQTFTTIVKEVESRKATSRHKHIETNESKVQ
jgi:hypothetical protein